MSQLKCRYCDQTFSGNSAFICKDSPTKRHVAVPDGVHCIHCGNIVRKNSAEHCYNSPTKRCQLY